MTFPFLLYHSRSAAGGPAGYGPVQPCSTELSADPSRRLRGDLRARPGAAIEPVLERARR